MMWLNGTLVARQIETLCRAYHEEYQAQYGEPASLGVINIGEDEASQVYISHKRKIAHRLGIDFQEKKFSSSTAPQEILDGIRSWSEAFSGIIIQLPLPAAHAPHRLAYLAAIPPEKDVDGLHPYQRSHLVPCTPLGCFLLLNYYDIPLQGAHCVVIGRSRLVGRPLAALLMEHHATVTITHSHTKDLALFARQADILCVCAGRKHLITPEYVNPHTVVLDIGIHRTAEGLTGDVSPSVYGHVKAISPVPKGIGPMTVISLMWNTLCAAFRAQGRLLLLEDLIRRLKAQKP